MCMWSHMKPGRDNRSPSPEGVLKYRWIRGQC
uniref:Uncharacterized protein n=1 Tax=Anguilla anguilla TaxID=7936 RepID=A0A0E9SBD6_ANGAN